VNLEVCSGEILGIAGVSGNGQTELAEAVAGLRTPSGGKLIIEGKKVESFTPRQMQRRGIRYIPEDRHRYGLVLKFSVQDNLLLSRYFEEPYSKKGTINHQYNSEFAHKKVAEFNIMTSGILAPVEHLSGGNQQKLILARELASQPKILLATQPARGLDVAATRFVQKAILRQKELGTAVIYISTALDEVIDMSDRIAVMYKGEIIGIFNADSADLKTIGALMAGSRKPREHAAAGGES